MGVRMRVDLVEYGVQRYPEGMEKWRMYRIEYGGHAEACRCEGVIWLPEHVDPEKFERFMARIQRK
jgi:hypothetical protein